MVIAGLFLLNALGALDDDGRLGVASVIGVTLLAIAGAVLMAFLYVGVNRLLHKKGYSLHDDNDFEE